MIFTVISVLIIIICVILTLMVLVQNSKGGGLASSFSSSNQVMGVRKTTDFLEKATWYLAAILIFLAYISTAFIPREDTVKGLIDTDQIENLAIPSAEPTFPVAPAAGTTTDEGTEETK